MSAGRASSLRRVMYLSAVAFGVVATVSTVLVVSLSSTVRAALDRGTDQLMADQHTANQIVNSSYGQQLAAFRYLETPSTAAREEFRDKGQQTYDHIRRYLFRPMPLGARLKVETIKEAHERFEVAAQRVFDLASSGEPAEAQRQVLVLTVNAAELERAVRNFIADREQQILLLRAGQKAELVRLQRAMIFLAVTLGFIVAWLAHQVLRRVMLPIYDLSAAVRAVSDGAERVHVAPQRYQEFQLLADSFDHMAERIRTSHDDVQSRNRELVRTLEDLRQAQRELVQHEKLSAMGEMLAGLAHELNNPLAGILGLAECLKADLADSSDAEVRNLGETLVAPLIIESLRARDLVRNLLHFSREAAPQLEAVQLSTALEVAVGLRSHAFTQKQMAIDVSAPTEWYVIAQQQKFELVIINVMNNALDAMAGAQGTRLRIEVTREDDVIAVAFEDDGPGFAEPVRSFEPFYTTKAIGAGTGLGLSLVHRFMEEFGGSACAENVPNGGARVTLRLRPALMPPVPPMPAAAMSSASHVIEETSTESIAVAPVRQRILVVDDEPAIRDVQRRMLRPLDADVATAANGTEAYDALRESRFDVVITDLRMPGPISGLDLLALIQRDHPSLAGRVIVVTGDTMSQRAGAALPLPADRVVTKPFSAGDYLACVRRALAAERV